MEIILIWIWVLRKIIFHSVKIDFLYILDINYCKFASVILLPVIARLLK